MNEQIDINYDGVKDKAQELVARSSDSKVLYANMDKYFNDLNTHIDKAIVAGDITPEQVVNLYYLNMATKFTAIALFNHKDDESFKEKPSERQLLDEFVNSAIIVTKEHLTLYLKHRLGDKYTSSKLRSVRELLKADYEALGIKNSATHLNLVHGVLNVENKHIEARNDTLQTSSMYDKFIPHYNPDATAPNFQRVLSELNTPENPSLGQDILKMYAYCAFGGNKQKIMFILYGDGDDGKSLIQNAIRNALGDYVGVIAPQKIRYSRTKEDQFQTWLLQMNNKRFGIVSEWGESDRLDNSIVKQVVSGGDSVAEVELKNQNAQKQINLDFTFVIDTNFLPEMTNVEPALIKRIAVMKFHKQYSESEKDLTLGQKLKAERAGILNMLIEAYDPNWKVPEKYKQALREEQAEQQAFIDDNIANVFNEKTNYAIDDSATEKILSRKIFTQTFMRDLRDNNLKQKDVISYLKRQGVKANNKDGRGFIGLRVKDTVSENYYDSRVNHY